MVKNILPIRLLIVATLLFWCFVPAVSADTARDAYVRAEACYKKLRNTPSAQKYRESWMTCIEKFRAVYRHTPEGPWAAAGLYMSGTLYAELYRHSGRTADIREAVDHFEQVQNRFPKSRYAGRAKKAAAAANGHNAATSEAKAAQPEDDRLYQSAESCTAELRRSPRKQKFRNNWIACIDKFEAAYKQSPTGPKAAAGLYMSGTLYGELYQWSQNRKDRQQAIDRLQQVVTHYPQSDQSPKAQEALRGISGVGAATAADGKGESAGAAGEAVSPTG
ncbi:MAG: tetratricopeptide repeat protein, partial [Desulfobacterales bacterium]|nr:tetratricopeptide repeat protein [Desulfobacterales bacterium]